MSKKLLSGPYLMWMIGFTIIPLALIVFYGLTDRSGAFTMANVLSIATAEHSKALWLSLGLSLISTVICFILAYPLALILRARGIGQGSFIVFIFDRRYDTRCDRKYISFFCPVCFTDS